MSQAPVTVKGADNLARTLGRAADDLEDMSTAGDRAGALILNTARAKAPRLTGALAGSLELESGPVEVSVSSPLEYAGRTHYGWAAVGQRAQPFLTDALALNEERVVGLYMGEVDQAIGQVKGV